MPPASNGAAPPARGPTIRLSDFSARQQHQQHHVTKPTALQSPRNAHLVEPSPLSGRSLSGRSAGSDTDISDYIGSGANTAGDRTPEVDRFLGPASESDLAFNSPKKKTHEDDDDLLSDEDDDEMSGDRPKYARHADGKSGAPLLGKGDEHRRYSNDDDDISRSPSPGAGPSRGRGRGRTSQLRSRSPGAAARQAARKKYMYSALFLGVTLVSFCIQTELAAYVQRGLGWNKAYCMLYLTHGSWAMLWPAQLLILRLRASGRGLPWATFWRRHVYLLRTTAHMVRAQALDVPRAQQAESPWPYLIRTTAWVTSALTVAGLSWYLAVDMTSPSDLTAIYNCSAFFAYAFSVPLLKEKLRLDKSVAVLIAIVGVLVVAYGDSKPGEGGAGEGGGGGDEAHSAGTRFLGNLIIGAGSVLYGLYEVLYKRYACPPEGVSAARGMIFANFFGSCIGLFTLTVLWVPLPILHILGWETFALPTGRTAWYLWLSVVMNATFAGSFLVLISLTSPVLSSVAALLTIFVVAIADWALTGAALPAAALAGGCLIIVAFLMLSWSTWREMTEETAQRAREGAVEVEYGDSVVGEESESDKD